MIREMMNMPAIQNLMNNPDFMRNLIMSNPQMREIIDRNPDLAHILNDPGTLRQTLDAARNPELMREMMRNTDRAMSNIESSPEGFNMLRRMYETVQEPFLNATTMGGDSGNELGSNPFSALFGQGLGQTRAQTANPSTTASDATGSPAPNTNPLPNPWNPSCKLLYRLCSYNSMYLSINLVSCHYVVFDPEGVSLNYFPSKHTRSRSSRCSDNYWSKSCPNGWCKADRHWGSTRCCLARLWGDGWWCWIVWSCCYATDATKSCYYANVARTAFKSSIYEPGK